MRCCQCMRYSRSFSDCYPVQGRLPTRYYFRPPLQSTKHQFRRSVKQLRSACIMCFAASVHPEPEIKLSCSMLIQVQKILKHFILINYCSLLKERSLVLVSENSIEFSRLSYCFIVKDLCDPLLVRKLYYLSSFLTSRTFYLALLFRRPLLCNNFI